MAQYVNKATLVAEIERINKSISPDIFLSEYEEGCNRGKEDVCDDLLSFINTLEVKDVDLEKDIDDWYNTMGIPVTANALKETARHFFELGLKAQKNKKL